jgi:hypothetical protein
MLQLPSWFIYRRITVVCKGTLAIHPDPMCAMNQIAAKEDGLPCSEVGAWTEDKYSRVASYDRLFSTGMKNQWPTRVYIHLYSGPGFARIRGTNRMMLGSRLLSLDVPDPFDKYIFCESDSALSGALKERVLRRSRKPVRVSYLATATSMLRKSANTYLHHPKIIASCPSVSLIRTTSRYGFRR